ncbi:P-loop NTPase [Verrucomicrobiota bacterium]
MSDCSTCPSASGCTSKNDQGCSSGAQPNPQQKLRQRMAGIKNKIVVMSGKGGVGKSTVSANLAAALSKNAKVGLLDVDFHGPSIPRMFDLGEHQVMGRSEDILPAQVTENLSIMSLGLFLDNASMPVIWRGARKQGAINQFLSDVEWGELDYLIVDCPPGTGDEPLGVIQTIGDATGSVIVTTPQEVALEDVRRSVSFCHEVNLPILGIVENMSGFACPCCDEVTHIFSKGGGEKLRDEMGVKLLGEIPIDPTVVQICDSGSVVAFQESGESAVAKAFDTIVANLNI